MGIIKAWTGLGYGHWEWEEEKNQGDFNILLWLAAWLQ